MSKASYAAAELVNLLRKHGVEVYQAKKGFVVKKEKFSTGSYIIRMDQPYSRCADMLLDTQYYSPNDPHPYDDTGWTLGTLHNVKTVRTLDQKVLKLPMTLLKEEVKIEGKVINAKNADCFLINYTAQNALAKLRYKLKEIKMWAAENSFSISGKKFNTGTFIIPVKGNSPKQYAGWRRGTPKPSCCSRCSSCKRPHPSLCY